MRNKNNCVRRITGVKRVVNNRGAEGGGWCEREFQEEAGEELVKVN